MNKFYVNIKSIKDKKIDRYLQRFDMHYLLYGVHEVFKNDLGQYQTKCPARIILDIKNKKSYVLCFGDMILYGRINDMSAKEFKDKTKTLGYQINEIRSINQQIKNLQNDKKNIIIKYKTK